MWPYQPPSPAWRPAVERDLTNMKLLPHVPHSNPWNQHQRDEPPMCGSDKQLHLHPGDSPSCWELRLHASRACAQTHLPQDPAQKQQFEKHIDHM